MQSLTLDDQDVEGLLNCPDGEARLPSTAVHSFRLSHAGPPDELVLPAGQTLGVFAAAIAIPRCRIGPSREGVLKSIVGVIAGSRAPVSALAARLSDRDPMAAELGLGRRAQRSRGVEVDFVD